MTTLEFTILGIPIPKGSTRSFAIARGKGSAKVYTGATVNMASNSDKLRPWEARVRDSATQAGATLTKGPVRIALTFTFRRPQSHFGSGKNAATLKATAPRCHVQKPDIDKLVRAILDGLTGVCYIDDSQVEGIKAVKRWNDEADGLANVKIEVAEMMLL